MLEVVVLLVDAPVQQPVVQSAVTPVEEEIVDLHAHGELPEQCPEARQSFGGEVESGRQGEGTWRSRQMMRVRTRCELIQAVFCPAAAVNA